MWFAIPKRGCSQKLNGFRSPFFFQENHHLPVTCSFIIPQPFSNYNNSIPHASIYVFIYGIKWLTDWLFKWLPDWLFDSLSTFTWLIGPNLRLSFSWPISSRKYWIYAALKHFILKEHKTIKRGSEFQNSWQRNFTVAWITGKYYQHISGWKGLQQSKLGEASGTLKSIGVDWCDWWLIERLLQGTKYESQVKRWLNRPSSDWP